MSNYYFLIKHCIELMVSTLLVTVAHGDLLAMIAEL